MFLHIPMKVNDANVDDNIFLKIFMRMFSKVKDATSAVANVDDYTGSARLLAATTLRKIYLYSIFFNILYFNL